VRLLNDLRTDRNNADCKLTNVRIQNQKNAVACVEAAKEVHTSLSASHTQDAKATIVRGIEAYKKATNQ